MFFNDWVGIIRVVMMGVLSYAAIIILLRIGGKRTLAKMNVFDFVMTIAIGSMLATIILSRNIALIEGILGLATLIGMQFAIAWFSSRSKRFRDVVKGEAALLFYEGEILHEIALHERITPPEIHAAMRESGFAHIGNVGAVILETDGSLSVLPKLEMPATTLEYVKGKEQVNVPVAHYVDSSE